MPEKWRFLSSIVMVLGAVLVLPGGALAESATVLLSDGRALEGELAEYVPSDHVTLVLGSGQRQQIAASEVASIKVHAAPAVSAEPVAQPTAAVIRSPVPGARGKWQVGLSAPLLRYNSLTREGDGLPKLESSGLQWGVVRAPIVELGYGVSDLILIGAVAHLTGDSSSTESLDSSSLALFLGPKLDFQLDTTSRFKPFFGAVLGLSYSSNENTPKASNVVASNSKTTLFRFQARAGVRWFVTDEVSLDLALVGGFDAGSNTIERSGDSASSANEKSDFSASGSFFGLNLGASVWPDLT